MNKDRRDIHRTLSLSHEGRRSGIDQREFSYTGVMPERRSGKERRRFV
jgi:hypothetical protein